MRCYPQSCSVGSRRPPNLRRWSHQTSRSHRSLSCASRSSVLSSSRWSSSCRCGTAESECPNCCRPAPTARSRLLPSTVFRAAIAEQAEEVWCCTTRLFTVEGVRRPGASSAGWGSRSSDDGGSHAAHQEDLDVPDVTFACPDLTTFCRLDELGLQVVGQRLEPDCAVLACRVMEPDRWCRRCGCEGTVRDTVTGRLAHEPLGWRPTTLEVTVRRYQCTGAGMCGARTPARPRRRGRSCRGGRCGGRWRRWCVST